LEAILLTRILFASAKAGHISKKHIPSKRKDILSLEHEVLSSNTKKDQQGLLQIIRHQDSFFTGSGEHLIQAESVLHKW
jgi:hypothetical protein